MIHFLAKRKAIRALRSNLRRASQIKKRKEGVEAINSWRRDATRKITSIFGEQDEFYEAIEFVRLRLMTARGRATSKEEYYRILDEACEVVGKCIGELKANGHPRHNTQPSPLWKWIVIPAILLAIGAMIPIVANKVLGTSDSGDHDPRQIKVDLANALKKFDFEYYHSYDSVEAFIYHRSAWSPGVIKQELKKYHDRALLERNAMIDSFLTAYAIAGGDTVGMLPVRRLPR